MRAPLGGAPECLGELFAEFGFEGATVERIARRAGVNRAMISYHFQESESST